MKINFNNELKKKVNTSRGNYPTVDKKNQQCLTASVCINKKRFSYFHYYLY